MNFGVPIAVLAAGLFGTGDFLGGLAARRASALTVTLLVSAIGALPVLALAAFVPGSPSRLDLAWGAAGGVCGAIGVTLLYYVLARGPVGVVAPVTALCGVAVPVAAGIGMGERPTLAAIAGMALAALAVTLIHGGEAPGARRAERFVVVLAVLSGLGLGAFLVLIGRVGAGAGLMPLIAARVAGGLTVGIALAFRRERPALPAGSRATGVAASLVDGLANVLYLLVVRANAVSIVGTIVSLGPAITVLLGRFVLNERFHRRQLIGLAVAAVAVVLLTRG